MLNISNVNEPKFVSTFRLLSLASGNSFNGVILYTMALSLLLALYCLFIGMSFPIFLFFLILMDAVIILFSLHYSFAAKCGWHNLLVLRRLLNKRDWIRHINGFPLTWSNNGWEYSNPDCFIRVSKHSACILITYDLDFSVSVIHTNHVIYDDFSLKRYCAESKTFDRYTLQCKDNSQVTIQLDRTDSFLKWITEHDARITWHK